MATEFNYKRAHREAVFPKYKDLPDDVCALFTQTQREAEELHQNKDMSMPWPETNLRAKFCEALTTHGMDTLAEASEVIYYLGHLDSDASQDLQFMRDLHGGHWKFQHYAREVLIDAGWKKPWPKLWEEGAFDDHEEGTDWSDKELPAILSPVCEPEMTVTGVIRCNYKVNGVSHNGHPFMIGPKHFQKDSIYLDPTCAPCAQCGAAWDAHTSDKVAVLKLAREPNEDKFQLTEKEIEKAQALEPLLKEHKIDGVVFEKGE